MKVCEYAKSWYQKIWRNVISMRWHRISCWFLWRNALKIFYNSWSWEKIILSFFTCFTKFQLKKNINTRPKKIIPNSLSLFFGTYRLTSDWLCQWLLVPHTCAAQCLDNPVTVTDTQASLVLTMLMDIIVLHEDTYRLQQLKKLSYKILVDENKLLFFFCVINSGIFMKESIAISLYCTQLISDKSHMPRCDALSKHTTLRDSHFEQHNEQISMSIYFSDLLKT